MKDKINYILMGLFLYFALRQYIYFNDWIGCCFLLFILVALGLNIKK